MPKESGTSATFPALATHLNGQPVAAPALKRLRGQRDPRVLFGLLLLLLALGGNGAFWLSLHTTTPVLTAAHDLTPGMVLSESDLTVSRVRLGQQLQRLTIPAERESEVIGKRVRSLIPGGALLLQPLLTSGPLLDAAHVAETLAVRAETSLNGELTPGDTVSILVTYNKGKPATRTVTLLPKVTVYRVGYAPASGSPGPSGTTGSAVSAEGSSIANLTLLLTPKEAEDLASAKANGDIDVVLHAPAN